ncbi:MAG: LPS assembly protein LptD [Lautropia sp.]
MTAPGPGQIPAIVQRGGVAAPRPALRRAERPAPRAVAFAAGLLAGIGGLTAAPALAQSGSAPAQSGRTVAQSDPALTLRLAPTLDLARPRGPEPAVSFGRADRLSSRQTPEGPETVLEGSAELRQAGATVRADRIEYRQNADEIAARGAVTIERQGMRLVGPSLRLKLDSNEGVFDSPTYDLAGTSGRGRADSVEMKGRGRFLLSNATFSTCRPDNEDWRIEARQIDLDQNAGEGKGHNARLLFKDRTILASPILMFPIDDERKSGILSPTFSVTSRSGAELTVPYYLNLAPNYDLTLSPRLSVRRGLQIGGDFRYLFRPMFGDIKGEYVPHDRTTGSERYSYNAVNTISDVYGWNGGWNVKGVSDDNYFVDYSRTLIAASERSLPRDVYLSRDFGQWNFLTRVTRYQNILEARLAPPFEKRPQFQLSTYRTNVHGFDIGLLNDVTWFARPLAGSAEGARTVINPSAAYPLLWPSGFITPKISLHASSYRLDQNPAGPTSLTRAVPTFSLDSGVIMERDSHWWGQPSIQTLEPRLFYVKTPYRDQSLFPVFDSAANDFNFAQLFSENPFTGHDRIADSNQLTAALVSRQIEAATGIERLRLALAQRYYFDTQRVTIPGLAARTDRRSDLLVAASAELGGGHGFDSGIQYALRDERIPRFNFGYRFWPGDRRLFNAGVRFQSHEYAQWDTSWQWPIGSRWSSLGKINYSFLQRKNDLATGQLVDVRPGLVEGLLGFEYGEDCWAARFVVQRFVTAAGRTTTAFFVQFDFRGLGRLGADPFNILTRNIPGYRIPDTRPAPSSRF